MSAPASFTPPRIQPPERPLGRAAFLYAFLRNPLLAAPRAAYEEDFLAFDWAGSPRYWVTSPALVKSVLLDQREKFQKITQIRLLSPLLGCGILTSEGAHWRWQRQAAAPMFRAQDLHTFVPEFLRAGEDAVARWRAMPPGSVHRIDADMTRATFDVISATLLPSADRTVAPAIERNIGKLQRHGGWDQLLAAMNAPMWFPRPGLVARVRAIRALRRSVASLVEEHRAGGAPARDDLLHRLIAARDPETGQGMDDEQLVDNLLTFYLAGHETTAKALTWTLYLLARSPQWTAMLREEIEQVTGGAPLGAAHMDRLVRVQQVLKESMRLYPPVPIMSRQSVEPALLGEREIPAGSSVLIPVYVIHRHRARWDRPDEFDPDRFSPSREGEIPRYQFMPFGAGPRICIGMAFAMLEATALLATFVRHATFEPVEGHEPMPIARVTLLPRGGMPLRVRF